ncbi:MAG: hypothetical protein ACOCRK_01370 [bacterium]
MSNKIKINDKVLDGNNDPIVNVQINVFNPDDDLLDSNILKQEYTNPKGEWELELKPGEYIIEYFHPKFKVFTEKIKVNEDGFKKI